MFIDSHCHIGPSNFGEEVDALVQRALDAGLTHLVHIGAGGDTSACHEAMVAHLQRERTIGAYAAAAEDEVPDAHAALADLLGCDRDEIALAESAQRAWSLAFSSLELSARDRILCFSSEYAGNAVAFLQAAKRTGCRLEVLPMRADGVVDLDRLAAEGAVVEPEPEGAPPLEVSSSFGTISEYFFLTMRVLHVGLLTSFSMLEHLHKDHGRMASDLRRHEGELMLRMGSRYGRGGSNLRLRAFRWPTYSRTAT